MAGQGEEIVKSEDEEHFRNPLGVTADEDCPDDHVRINVVFPGLKKKTLRNEASNGTVDIDYKDRSFILKLTMTKKESNKKKGKEEKYRYAVKKLPDEIIPTKCYHKIKDGQVVLFLRKSKSRSWARELAETGPETYEDEEMDET